MENSLVVRPVNLEADYDQCRRFHEDTYVCSYGTHEGFFATFGSDGAGFRAYLSSLLDAEPGSVAHLFHDGQVLGQVELGAYPADPSVGYVYIYYLVPDARGKGVSQRLDEYAMTYFRRRGFSNARLSVTVTNLQAIRFYEKSGWRQVGLKPDASGVLLMEKSVGG